MKKKLTLQQTTSRVIAKSIIIFCIVFFITDKNALCFYNDESALITANDYMSKGKFIEALGLYQEIAALSGDVNNQARALLFIGCTYINFLDQYESAVNLFDKIMIAYPGTHAASDALFNRGMALYESGNYKAARKAFIDYLNHHPEGMRVQSAAVWADRSRSLMNGAKDHIPVISIVSDEETTIRVLIKKHDKNITLASKGKIKVIDKHSGRTLYYGHNPAFFSSSGKHLVFNNRFLKTDTCIVKPDDSVINMDGLRYRGFFKISSEKNGLNAFNIVNIEAYLYGVVPEEMPHSWEKHALMAQAVAARTYALYVKEKRKFEPYDLNATTTCQVYGGYDSETPESNKAVDATRGHVMTYNNDLIIAYYHSNSGGHTEDPANVWNNTSMPYLKGIPDRYSVNIPSSAWKYFISYNTTKKRLGKSGLKTGNIRKVRTSGKSRSGRVVDVLLASNNGVSRMKSNSFRIKIGESKLKSTNFRVVNHPDGILFTGKGYGHGVGMSQWGARKMAQEGSSYLDILNFYYQNIKIRNLF